MGSQSQAPQQAQARPMATHAQNANNSNGNALSGAGSLPRLPSLSRQQSIYSVTLDELQRSVLNQDPGQAFGSMNMDDFLRNIWTMEEQQAMAQMVPVGSEGGEELGRAESDPPVNGSGCGVSLPRQPSLLKQPSLPVALPRTLSRKTVDEVWRDIVKTNPSLDPHGGNGGGEHVSAAAGAGVKGGKTTYGEMTLEDFLVKSGVVKDGENLPTDIASLNLVFASPNNGAGSSTDRGNERERMGPGSLAATLSLSPANGIGSQTGMEAYNQAQAQAQAHAQVQAQAQAHAQAQVQAQVHAHAQAQGAEWMRDFQQQQRMFQAQAQAQAQAQQAQQAQAQAQAQQAQAADAYSKRLANGGMLTNMSSNGGYTGIASALAPGLGGPIGMQLASPMGLGLAHSSPAHSPNSDGVDHSHGNGLSLSPVGNYGVDGAMRGRKRGAEGPGEKVVERRQRRMIKNRESAARSRARKQVRCLCVYTPTRSGPCSCPVSLHGSHSTSILGFDPLGGFVYRVQAYTVELEAEVTQLKEENSRLRREKVSNHSLG